MVKMPQTFWMILKKKKYRFLEKSGDEKQFRITFSFEIKFMTSIFILDPGVLNIHYPDTLPNE